MKARKKLMGFGYVQPMILNSGMYRVHSKHAGKPRKNLFGFNVNGINPIMMQLFDAAQDLFEACKAVVDWHREHA